MAKSERIDLLRKVYSKSEYTKIINTDFTQLGVSTVAEIEDNEVTVEQFFGYYNDLFYDIPVEGETNSHEYLAKTSGEYVGFDQESEEIEALRKEITGLREELLQAQIESVANEADIATGNKEIGDAIRQEASLALDSEGNVAAIDGTTTDNRSDNIEGVQSPMATGGGGANY
tara:strand:- start:613 stop:1131 length:519 start_codon:yes stop_codon:yes gene_type:complete